MSAKQELLNDFQALLERWQMSARAFVHEFLGVKSISKQQQQALKAMTILVRAKLKKWRGEKLSKTEAKYVDRIGISIRSGKGTGKDALSAWGVLWFLVCFHNSKIPMTGPSKDQVQDILLAEINKWLTRLDEDGQPACMFPSLVSVQTNKVFINGGDNPGKSWFARIRVARQDASDEQKAKTLDGWHEDFMMIMVDEAASVSDPVFKAFDTTLTSPVNWVLMAFNPSRTSGYAFETHFGKRKKYWIRLHFDARKSELVSKTQIETIRDTYGEDSVEYQVNVLGNPPKDTARALIPYDRLRAAVNRDLEAKGEPIVFGVDVARQGEDKTVVVVRQGFKVREIFLYGQKDTVDIGDIVSSHIIDFNPERVYIDTCGLGVGLYDILKRKFPGKCYPVDVNRKATLAPKSIGRGDKMRFNRLRDELYWRLRTVFVDNMISIPKSPELMQELSSIKEEDTEDGRLKIESKVRYKRMGGKSPNIADALMITMMANIQALRARKRDQQRVGKKKSKISAPPSSWMTA